MHVAFVLSFSSEQTYVLVKLCHVWTLLRVQTGPLPQGDSCMVSKVFCYSCLTGYTVLIKGGWYTLQKVLIRGGTLFSILLIRVDILLFDIQHCHHLP